MENNNQGLQANPQLTINYLTQEVAKLTQENAMLKAIIQEQNSESAEEE
ncbi:hypothetical protein WL766_06450 [Staphylococcus pasteuri]|nr:MULTISPECIES: hypothetical protein [Staphylococcus]MBM6506704.1 hypothetical protein [Staphylococcus pasteuri]MCO0861841.1 hypothetical protein [Staphylococcus pasteuri]MCO5360664.1 hypothetical protein [Staphylococcus pasteuri]MCT1926305.1 hypothetical protein [Staphylococcus pasteuri]QQT19244.1 hypothetical protein I6J08_06345 [Staphylococcus pasteuri]